MSMNTPWDCLFHLHNVVQHNDLDQKCKLENMAPVPCAVHRM